MIYEYSWILTSTEELIAPNAPWKRDASKLLIVNRGWECRIASTCYWGVNLVMLFVKNDTCVLLPALRSKRKKLNVELLLLKILLEMRKSCQTPKVGTRARMPFSAVVTEELITEAACLLLNTRIFPTSCLGGYRLYPRKLMTVNAIKPSTPWKYKLHQLLDYTSLKNCWQKSKPRCSIWSIWLSMSDSTFDLFHDDPMTKCNHPTSLMKQPPLSLG